MSEASKEDRNGGRVFNALRRILASEIKIVSNVGTVSGP